MTTNDPTPIPPHGSTDPAPSGSGMAPAPQPRVEGPAGVDTSSQTTGTGQKGGNDATQDRGREVAGHARSEVEETAEHASERVKDVAETAKSEVRDVVDEARDALRKQADEQSKAAAGAISKLRDDLQAMSNGDTPRDATADYLQRAAGSLDDVVGRLEREGIEGALSGIRRFARRSPGGFLAASAGAGFAVSRLIRNADHPQQVPEQSDTGESSGNGNRDLDLTDDATNRPQQSTDMGAFVDGGVRR